MLFLSLFNYTVEKVQRLRAVIKNIPRNAMYTSSDMQNELIAAMSSVVTENILSKNLEILGIKLNLMATRTQLVMSLL